MVFNKETLRKVRIFLIRIPRRKILTFSFFLLLATIFWVMQIYRQSFEVTTVIPIKYVQLSEDIILRYQLPTHLSVKLRDDGSSLFKYYLTKRNDSLVIDIDKLIKDPNNQILQGSFLEQMIRQNLFNSSTLINYSPIRISLAYDSLQSKKVPVIFDGQVYLASGYLLSGGINVVPDSVMIYTTDKMINKISYAYTVADTVYDFKSDKPLLFKLVSGNNYKFSPSEVLVEVPIEEFTQKELNIPITCLNIPDNLGVKFFPSTAKISFFVGLSKYKSIVESDFEIQFDYNNLKEEEQSTVPIRLTLTPDYIRNLRIEPSEVEFILEQK